jgi:hypothetical protein
MKTINRLLPLILASVLLICGCDKNPAAPEYEKEISVFGYLWGNEVLTAEHAILVAYTQPILEYYDLEKAGIRNASVTITEAGTGKVYQLQDAANKPGFYYNDSLLVRPKATYQLRIEIDGKVVTASTTVPPDLEMTTILQNNSINYEYQNNLSREKPIYLECELPEQVVLVDMYCNEPYDKAEYINPFYGSHKYPGDEDEYDSGIDGEPRHIKAIGRLKDFISADYPNEYVVFWYSSMIVFYGSYTMKVMAIDDNYQKFNYKEHPELESGVQDGLGVFGSVTGKAFELSILKP